MKLVRISMQFLTRHLIPIFFIFYCFTSSNAQENYSIYIIDYCDSSNSSLNCELQGINGIIPFDSIQNAYIIENGQYVFTAILNRGKYFTLYNQELYTSNFSSNSDTIAFGKIYICSEKDDITKVGFCCCDQLCNGYCVDYYKNGTKRIEGNFVEGVPRGKIIYYKPNGTINFIEKYSKSGKLKKTIKK